MQNFNLPCLIKINKLLGAVDNSLAYPNNLLIFILILGKEVDLLDQLLKLGGERGIFLPEKLYHVEMKVGNYIHILVSIGPCQFLADVDHVAIMVNVHKIAQSDRIVLPVPASLDVLPGGLWDFDQDVVDVALPAPHQPEPVIVVDDHVVGQADPHRVHFVLAQHVPAELLHARVCERNGRNVLYELVEGEIEFGLEPRVEHLVGVAVLLHQVDQVLELLLVAAQGLHLGHVDVQVLCELIEEVVLRGLIVGLEHEGPKAAFNEEHATRFAMLRYLQRYDLQFWILTIVRQVIEMGNAGVEWQLNLFLFLQGVLVGEDFGCISDASAIIVILLT